MLVRATLWLSRLQTGGLLSDIGRHTEHVLEAEGLFPSGHQTHFPIPDLSGRGRGAGEEVGAAALNDVFLMGLEKLCCPPGGLQKPSHVLGAGC